MTSEEEIDRRLLRAILDHVHRNGVFPMVEPFRKQMAEHNQYLDTLEAQKKIRSIH